MNVFIYLFNFIKSIFNKNKPGLLCEKNEVAVEQAVEAESEQIEIQNNMINDIGFDIEFDEGLLRLAKEYEKEKMAYLREKQKLDYIKASIEAIKNKLNKINN